jgi:glycosyltransferase involved in cell wall biosynthesis
MNIVLINQYAGSLRHGMEYRPYYLAREWQRRGHRVTIVAGSFSHLRTRAPQLRGGRTSEDIDGLRYVWLWTPGYRGNGARRALNLFAFAGQLLRYQGWLRREAAPGVVIASSTHPLDVAPARRLARAAGARLIFEVHDLWPLSPIELGGISPRHPFMQLLQWAEDYAYRHADHVVSMLPNAEAHMRAHGLAPGKFLYVPNGIDLEEWERAAAPLPDEPAALIARLRAEGRFLVGYAGAHGVANALHSLLAAAERLRGAPVAWLLVGQGPEKAALERIARERGLSDVHFLAPVAKAAIPALLAELDALYIGLQSQPLFRFGVSPNKLMDYMMAARPVLYAIAAGNDPVAESGCGLSVPPEDDAAIADAVRRLMALGPEARAAMGVRGRAYVRAHHDYRVLAERFARLWA